MVARHQARRLDIEEREKPTIGVCGRRPGLSLEVSEGKCRKGEKNKQPLRDLPDPLQVDRPVSVRGSHSIHWSGPGRAEPRRAGWVPSRSSSAVDKSTPADVSQRAPVETGCCSRGECAGASPPPGRPDRATAPATYCRLRRVLRSRRSAPAVAPGRHPPTGALAP